MKRTEAEEFAKLFEAMDKRFRSKYNAPVVVTEGGTDVSGFWILTTFGGGDRAYLVTHRNRPNRFSIKKLLANRSKFAIPGRRAEEINNVQFRIWGGYLRFCSGDNSNLSNCGPRMVTISLWQPYTPWVGGAKNLFNKLGEIEEIRRELSDPSLDSLESPFKRVNI